MKKTSFLFTLMLAGIVFAGLTLAIEAPQEEIWIKGKRPAGYNHKPHLDLGLKCGACHHKSIHSPYSDEEVRELADGLKLHCRFCHNDEYFSEPRLSNIKLIMHKLCKGCHREGINGVKGPTKCLACHKKKE